MAFIPGMARTSKDTEAFAQYIPDYLPAGTPFSVLPCDRPSPRNSYSNNSAFVGQPLARQPFSGWNCAADVTQRVLHDSHAKTDAYGQPVSDDPADPVVFVAHSFGGYIAEMAAYLLEDRVPGILRGIVFLDSSTTGIPNPVMGDVLAADLGVRAVGALIAGKSWDEVRRGNAGRPRK